MQAELLYRRSKIIKEKVKSCITNKIREKFGTAATEDKMPRKLLLGQSERQVE